MSLPYFLYADDDPEDVQIFRETFNSGTLRYDLRVVEDGYELINALQDVLPGRAFPSLIILDLQMPKLNGLETARLLRSDDMYCLIPIVMLTGSANVMLQKTCERLGASLYVKPALAGDWEELIHSLIISIED